MLLNAKPGSITWSGLWGANFELQTAQQGKTVPSSKRFSAQFFISWMFRCEYENTGRAPAGLGAPCGAGGSRAEPPGCSPSHHPRQGAGQLGGAGGHRGQPGSGGPWPGMAELWGGWSPAFYCPGLAEMGSWAMGGGVSSWGWTGTFGLIGALGALTETIGLRDVLVHASNKPLHCLCVHESHPRWELGLEREGILQAGTLIQFINISS